MLPREITLNLHTIRKLDPLIVSSDAEVFEQFKQPDTAIISPFSLFIYQLRNRSFIVNSGQVRNLIETIIPFFDKFVLSWVD